MQTPVNPVNNIDDNVSVVDLPSFYFKLSIYFQKKLNEAELSDLKEDLEEERTAIKALERTKKQLEREIRELEEKFDKEVDSKESEMTKRVAVERENKKLEQVVLAKEQIIKEKEVEVNRITSE